MAKKLDVRVERSRSIYTYAELWHASDCVLQTGCREPRASSYQFLSSAILTAFTFEAYLNHAGERTLSFWKELDRIRTFDKLEVLRDALDVTPWKPGERPLQTIKKLFDLRNALAHGRSNRFKDTRFSGGQDYDALLGEKLLTDWEQLIQTSEFATRAREDVKAVLTTLHEARRDDKELLFGFGESSGMASLVED